MREAASYPERVLAVPAPNALIMAFGETAIELELRFWIEDAQNGVHKSRARFSMRSGVYFGKRAFRFPIPSGICSCAPNCGRDLALPKRAFSYSRSANAVVPQRRWYRILSRGPRQVSQRPPARPAAPTTPGVSRHAKVETLRGPKP